MAVRIEFQADTKKAVSDVDRLNASVQNIDNNTKKLGKSFKDFAISLGVFTAGASAVKGLIQMSDGMTNLSNRIALVTGKGKALNATMGQLRKISRDTRSEVGDLAVTFNRLALNAGLGTGQALQMTKTLQQTIKISGASAAEAGAAMLQLSQGIASGVLRGDELNSVMEQAPRIAQVLAKELGVSIGKLKEMGQAGEITTDVIVRAFKNAREEIQAEFDLLAPTISEGIREIQKSLVDVMREFLAAFGTGKGRGLGQVFVDWSKSITEFSKVVGLQTRIMINRFIILKSYLYTFWYDLKNFDFSEIINSMFSGISTSLVILERVFQAVYTWARDIRDIFWDLYIEVVGNSIWPDMLLGIFEWTVNYLGLTWKHIADFGKRVIEVFKDMGSATKTFFKNFADAVGGPGFATAIVTGITASLIAAGKFAADAFAMFMETDTGAAMGRMASRAMAVFTNTIKPWLAAQAEYWGATFARIIGGSVYTGLSGAIGVLQNVLLTLPFAADALVKLLAGKELAARIFSAIVSALRIGLVGGLALRAVGFDVVGIGTEVVSALSNSTTFRGISNILFKQEKNGAGILAALGALLLVTKGGSGLLGAGKAAVGALTPGGLAGQGVVQRFEAYKLQKRIDPLLATLSDLGGQQEAQAARTLKAQAEMTSAENDLEKARRSGSTAAVTQAEIAKRTAAERYDYEKDQQKALGRTYAETSKKVRPLERDMQKLQEGFANFGRQTKDFLTRTAGAVGGIAGTYIGANIAKGIAEENDWSATGTLIATAMGAVLGNALLGIASSMAVSFSLTALGWLGKGLTWLAFQAAARFVATITTGWVAAQVWAGIAWVSAVIAPFVASMAAAGLGFVAALGAPFLLLAAGIGFLIYSYMVDADWLKMVRMWVTDFIEGAVDIGVAIWEAFKTAAMSAKDFVFGNSDTGEKNLAMKFWDYLTTPVVIEAGEQSATTRRDVQKRASGGPVRGPGSSRSDSIPAMLSNGEFVVNARDTARNYGTLVGINSGMRPRGFADGTATVDNSMLDMFIGFFKGMWAQLKEVFKVIQAGYKEGGVKGAATAGFEQILGLFGVQAKKEEEVFEKLGTPLEQLTGGLAKLGIDTKGADLSQASGQVLSSMSSSLSSIASLQARALKEAERGGITKDTQYAIQATKEQLERMVSDYVKSIEENTADTAAAVEELINEFAKAAGEAGANNIGAMMSRAISDSLRGGDISDALAQLGEGILDTMAQTLADGIVEGMMQSGLKEFLEETLGGLSQAGQTGGGGFGGLIGSIATGLKNPSITGPGGGTLFGTGGQTESGVDGLDFVEVTAQKKALDTTFLASLGSIFENGASSFAGVFTQLGSALSGLFGGGAGGGGAWGSILQTGLSFFDNGGTLGPNQYGIVGERGAEIVSGPAKVTGRTKTAGMMGEGGVTNNLTFALEGDFDSRAERAIRKMINSGQLQNSLNSSEIENGGSNPIFRTP